MNHCCYAIVRSRGAICFLTRCFSVILPYFSVLTTNKFRYMIDNSSSKGPFVKHVISPSFLISKDKLFYSLEHKCSFLMLPSLNNLQALARVSGRVNCCVGSFVAFDNHWTWTTKYHADIKKQISADYPLKISPRMMSLMYLICAMKRIHTEYFFQQFVDVNLELHLHFRMFQLHNIS